MIEISYYKEADYPRIQQMILNSYSYTYPIFGISRLEFSRGLHPKFTGMYQYLERTAGVFRREGKIVACTICEASDEADCFFLFAQKEDAKDQELLAAMLQYCKKNMSKVEADGVTRFAELRIHEKDTLLSELAEQYGYHRTECKESLLILDFPSEKYPVQLPDGYSFVDGTTAPAFYMANVHMNSFNYSMSRVKEGRGAFEDLRSMEHYDPRLNLFILDSDQMPVAVCNIWYAEGMPYCELEPLGVVWWERRKGLATALLYEAANRTRSIHPSCKAMLGGDQPFYQRIGYQNRADYPIYRWETKIYPSWDERSKELHYQL